MLKNILYHIKRLWHFIKSFLFGALPASIYYGFPSQKLKVLAITGTDGKTTSSTLLYHTLKTAGKKAALFSTVAAYIGNNEIDVGLHVTTPEPWKIQKLLKRCVDEKVEYVVIEMTSHGIYQFRVWGIIPMIMGLTNITHEHLDYHVTFANYLKAKVSKLKQADIAVINSEDKYFHRIAQELNLQNQKTLNEKETRSLSSFIGIQKGRNLETKKNTIPKPVLQAIHEKFKEPYNHQNALLVYTMTKQLRILDTNFTKAVKTFPGIPGRMMGIKNNKGFQIVIDFAHTPNSLKRALEALRKQLPKNKKLIAVFGAAGLRDVAKRPIMGKHASEIADLVVLTAEDPRTEDVWSIIRQIKEGVTDQSKITSIPDRYKAIEFALTKLAKKGDIIGIFGKGHEKSMCFGTKEYPWNDAGAVKEILNIQ